MSFFSEELRDKKRMARRGRGSKKRTRFVSLPRSEFARYNYSDVQSGIDIDRRTTVKFDSEPTAEQLKELPKNAVISILKQGQPKGFTLTLSKSKRRFEKYQLKF